MFITSKEELRDIIYDLLWAGHEGMLLEQADGVNCQWGTDEGGQRYLDLEFSYVATAGGIDHVTESDQPEDVTTTTTTDVPEKITTAESDKENKVTTTTDSTPLVVESTTKNHGPATTTTNNARTISHPSTRVGVVNSGKDTAKTLKTWEDV